MAESLCSCCYFLGKPPARVNFILLTGLPESPVRNRIRWLLTHSIKLIKSSNIVDLTDYQSLDNENVGLFNQTSSSIMSNSASKTSPVQKCCCGSYNMSICAIDPANSTQWETFKENILDQVKPKSKSDKTKMNDWRETPTWIILDESSCLEPKFLDIFLRPNIENKALLDFTFVVLCILGNEFELFENCVLQRITIDDYESIIYPMYKRRINDFFSLLHSSPALRKHTVLVEQKKLSKDAELEALLRKLLHYDAIKRDSFEELLDHYVMNLPSFCQRTIQDISKVRSGIRERFDPIAENDLKSLYSSLQGSSLNENIIYQIARLVFIDFEYMEAEILTIYKKKLIRGFNKDDFKNSNTIAARLIHHALELNRKQESATIPLIYSIVLIICNLGKNITFRHDLFDYIPEIYTLSMTLVTQQQYALVLAGLKLCTTILDGDLIEYKYANEYLKHDPHPARKMMDAIKWLLSPYQTIQTHWREKLRDKDLENTYEQELITTSLERRCCNHTAVLADRQYLQGLVSLLCGSLNQCLEMTVHDVRTFAESIDTLADSRLSRWRRLNEKHFNLMLISNLCSILIPILQYSSPDVSSALRRESPLLKVIPEAIQILSDVDTESSIDSCFRFYSLLIQMKRKDLKHWKVDETEKPLIVATEEVSTNMITTHSTETTTPLNLTRDLIVSYFDLNRKYSKFILQDEISARNNAQKSLDMEWENFDLLELKYKHEQLKEEYSSLQDMTLRWQEKFRCIESERNQLQMDNNQLRQKIDCREMITTTHAKVNTQLPPNSVSSTRGTEGNIIEKLRDVSPNEITEEQAKMFIEEIHRRRMAFDDEDMRKSICGSLKHLGSHLYTSPVHFLHELIQNAEDNFYDSEMTPSLRIVLNHELILLSNNEKGLRPRDVLAICSLAVTTKQLGEHIGEKGVGFKSVFAASNRPTLISRAWKFAFHASDLDAMSYIAPVWVSNEDIPNRIRIHIEGNKLDTHLYLPLKPQSDLQACDKFLDQVTGAVDSCVLLTLHRLKKLEIIDERQNKTMIIEKQTVSLTSQEKVIFESLEFINLTGSRIQLSTSTGERNFRVYTCDIDVPSGVELRQKTSKPRLTLAFPCEADYCLEYTVYAGLPVCDLGFGFLFSGDFELVTNRESVREDVPFNRILRDYLATLFVYLLMNDVDIRKDMDRYWTSSTTNKAKHSSLWSGMVIKINDIIKKNLPIFLNSNSDKAFRRFNPELAKLVSNEQLYNCADIQVIISANSIFTDEQLKEFQIQPVSALDVLNCLPNRDEKLNESRQNFCRWAHEQSQDWWDQFFQHIAQIMTEQDSDLLLRKPIFLQFDHRRQHLSTNVTSDPLLFISDDSELRMWKRQITLLKYASKSERTALRKSNRVQLLTDDELIKIIRNDHLQIGAFFNDNNITEGQIEEIWRDLVYLRTRLDKLDRTTRFLAPKRGSIGLVAIQDATLPTILGVDIQPFLNSPTSSILHYPYYTCFDDQLNDSLQWEYFFLQMKCHPPAIHIPISYIISRLPVLPSFTMFKNEEMARLALDVFSSQLETTQDHFRQFLIRAERNNREESISVSTTFNEKFAPSLTWLPRVTIPFYCCPLAAKLGVCANYDLQTCVRVLQLLGNAKSTDLQLYIEWLGHLQLFILQQGVQSKPTNLLSLCSIYLPDQQDVCLLKDLLIVPDHIEYRAAIMLVSKYLKFQVISPSNNQIYWPFENLFRTLNCSCAVTISNIFETIHSASCDPQNFHTVGDCTTLLTELGVETMLTVYKYLEYLILQCVKQSSKDEELFNAIVKQRHPTAPYGSRDDWKWRFGFTCNSLSKRLRIQIGMDEQRQKLPLLTIDKQLIDDFQNTIVYACMERNIIRHFAKNPVKRYFISPSITCACPLVLAAFQIDYIERRGTISWVHKTNNTEYFLRELTDCFRQTLEDSELEVITSVYANVNLLLSDSILLNPNSEDVLRDIDSCQIENDYPFWVFNKTILLCISSIDDYAKKASVAMFALITMLNKRKLMSIEEAKLLAWQKINTCTTFHSKEPASVACRKSTYYSYIDLLFPTDQYAIESSVIMIGKQFGAGQDVKNKYTRKVAIDREAEDQVYRSRAQEQDHRHLIREQSNVWMDPKHVDYAERIRIGENAEHFFFAYLQKWYGTEFVTPTRNWRSSTRLKIYPDCRDNVENNAGYDFELQDTDGIFAQGSGSNTIRCFFEVKGTSGSFNEEKTRFYISENELNTCKDIACNKSRLQHDAYLLVFVQYSLDSQRISLGDVINWSENFERVRRTVDGYVCNIVPASSFDSGDVVKRNKNDDDEQERERTSEDVENNNNTEDLSSTNNQACNSNRYVIPAKRNPTSKQSTDTDCRAKGSNMYRHNKTWRS